jgi:AcrR family transcriptional regulator
VTLTKPQQKRSEQTLERILRACDKLSAQRSFEQISMQDIAREAGVSVGNLYNRFSDKEGLVTYAMTRRQADFENRVAEAMDALPKSLNAGARLAIIVDALVDAVPGVAPLLVSAASRRARGDEVASEVHSGADTLVEKLTAWLRAGDTDLDPERCRFAVASIAWALQFDAIFGTPTRMFGLDFREALVDQGLAYIGGHGGPRSEKSIQASNRSDGGAKS